MITRYLLLPILAGAMLLSGCEFSLPGEQPIPTTEPTSIVQPTTIPPTAIPTAIPTPTTGPQVSPTPVLVYGDLGGIFGSYRTEEDQTYFSPGQLPWVADKNTFLLVIADDGTRNYATACKIAEGAADDGLIDLNDYGMQPHEGGILGTCYLIASRPSSGTPYAHNYVIERDGDNGRILNVQLSESHLHMLQLAGENPESFESGSPQCYGTGQASICVEPDAYALTGRLEPVLP